MKVLYVTSVNKQLWNICGSALVESFLSVKVNGNLLVTYENNLSNVVIKTANSYSDPSPIMLYNLDNDKILSKWLDDNKDIIPKELGGLVGPCNCKLGKDIWKTCDHKKGCLRTYYNFRASQWFRKIIALKYALTLSEFKMIVFVDADVTFLQQIPKPLLLEAFGDTGMFYHLGEKRRKVDLGIEAGFIGWREKHQGFELLQLMIDYFLDGRFRKYERFDDGYVIKKVIEENPQYPTRDLVKNQKGPKEAIQHGLFSSYIRHNKGKFKYKILDKYIQ